MKRLSAILAMMLFAVGLSAAERDFVVSSAEELHVLGTLRGGSEVVWRNGDYADEVITINASGTAKNPVVVRAESDGGVRFTGKSLLRIKGSNIVVRGFVWDNPTLEKGVVVSFDRASSHSLLEECVIKGDRSEMRPANNIKWVSVWGYRNRVERCSFIDKRDLGQILIVRLAKDEKSPQHIVRNCYFTRPKSLLNEKGGRINGQCCIRFGTSDVAQQQAECVVENCYFDRCNGEGEIISSKSCGNVFRNNLFYKSNGSLTLRHGNNSQVLNNYFIGKNAPLSAGVRIVGEGHTIRGNYFEQLQLRTYGAIHMIMGQENATAGGYQQVKGVTISENTIVDCACGITAHNARHKDSVMPILSTTVERNIVVIRDEGCSVASENGDHDIAWRDNIVYGGTQRGVSLAEVDTAPKCRKVGAITEKISTAAGATFMKHKK